MAINSNKKKSINNRHVQLIKMDIRQGQQWHIAYQINFIISEWECLKRP